MQKCVSHSVVYDSLGPRQTPLSMGFSGKNTGVDCHSLLQGIFPTQGSNLGLLHCRQILYHLSHLGSCDICSDTCFPSLPCISV